MKLFQPKLFSSVKANGKKQILNDIIAGIIVAIIALPLSIALAIASGVSPEKGLYTAIVAGFVISFFGGSSVNISGPTAAFATIVAGIVATAGTSGLVIATIMAGVILIIMGLCRLGSLIKYIPYTITTGFTAGIAVTIAIGQVKDFMGLTFNGSPIETMEKVREIVHNIGTVNPMAVLVGIISLAILIVWPRVSKKIPGSLIAVIVGVVIVKAFDMPVNTIGDLYTITSAPPTFAMPEFSFEAIGALLPSAFTIALLAGIESLLSCVVSDGMVGDRHNSNTELMAQGLGNIFSGLFGGIPATGAIARTAANVKNGGRTPIAGIVHAAVLLLILVVLMPYAALIPMPVIASILFVVAYNMSEWRHFVEICRTAPKSDIIVLIITFVLTVVFDLVVAIEVGMVVAAFLFMKRMSDVTGIRIWSSADEKNARDAGRLKKIPSKTEVFEIEGPMFFATSDKVASIPVKGGIKVLILRMRNVPSLDASAMRAMWAIHKYCTDAGVTLILSHANEQPLAVMEKAGFIEAVGEENIMENIDAALERAEMLNK